MNGTGRWLVSLLLAAAASSLAILEIDPAAMVTADRQDSLELSFLAAPIDEITLRYSC